MGDVAMTVPVIERLLQSQPNLTLSILSKPFFEPIFEGLPRTRFFSADVKGKHKGIVGLWRLAKELKASEIEAVADLHRVLRSRILCFFLFFLGIPSKSLKKGRAEKRQLVREKNKIFRALPTSHERYAAVFQNMGYFIELKLPTSRRKQIIPKEMMQLLDIDFSKKMIGIAPFAAHKSKQYPIASMMTIINTLAKDLGFQIILFGGGQDEASQLEKIASTHQNILNLAGKFSFKEELILISNLDLMLSMDSGNGHLAAIYGVEVLTIWMGTHPHAGFAPFNQSSDQQIIPDLKKFPYLPNSIFGKSELKDYEAIANSIPAELILEKMKQKLGMS